MSTQFYLDWGTNGVLTSPTNNIGGNLPLETNPITGSGLVNGEATSDDITTYYNAHGLADTFSGFLSANGYDPSALNEFQLGTLFEPVATPEPVSLALMAVGIAGLGAARRYRRRV